MYGLILENIGNYLRAKHGERQWKEILFLAGVDEKLLDNHFSTDEVGPHLCPWEEGRSGMGQVYSEGIVHRILWAAQDISGEAGEDMLRNIGHTFYTFLTKFNYHKILRVLGRSFPGPPLPCPAPSASEAASAEFLNGLDNLHEYLKFTYPKLKPPSFYCEHESRTGLTLHYR